MMEAAVSAVVAVMGGLVAGTNPPNKKIKKSHSPRTGIDTRGSGEYIPVGTHTRGTAEMTTQ